MELRSLPTYARGLLHIRVPVQVKLASQRKSVQEIIELGPGSIVKFEKTYDEPLEVCIGGRTIAEGEVVKVGDKFGVRISGLVK
jgi:flagellar motor switch protein FliN/FliY